MTDQTPRYTGNATAAPGWRIGRATRQSRLFGANGMRVGSDGRIYVAQVAGSQVSAIDPDSGAIEAFSPMGAGITGPDDLAFDSAGNLYCTEITENRVVVRRPDGRVDVLMDDVPVANPITCHQDRLIVGECRIGARIMEVDRATGSARTILADVPMVNAFEVGPDGKLYFPVMGANQIWRIDLAGGAPEVVASDLGVPDSVKFDSKGMIISTQVASGQVLRIDPRTGDRTVIADIGPGLDNCAMIGDRVFVSHITGSVHEIGPDGQVRALVEKGLQWPMGLGVDGAGTLYIADGGFSYTMQPGGAPVLAGMLFSPGYPGFTRGVASDGAGGWLVTTALGTVCRWQAGAPEHGVLSSGHELLMGVAPLGSGAVFADAGRGTVEAVEGETKSELATGLDYPTGIAVAADGTVYVSESGAGRVVKLSGGRSETVLDGLGRPEGLALRDGRLYAVDTQGKSVIELDLASGARTTIASGLPVGAPAGVKPVWLGGVGDMCGPMVPFTGLAAAVDGTLYVAGDAEGSVLTLRPE